MGPIIPLIVISRGAKDRIAVVKDIRVFFIIFIEFAVKWTAALPNSNSVFV
jgi:hypothetical protein